MLAFFFLAYVAAVAVVVVTIVARYIDRRRAIGLAAGLCVWFAYIGLISYSGIVAQAQSRPPGIVFVFVPVLVFILVAAFRSSVTLPLVRTVPLWLLLGLQSFRIGVELFLHQMWKESIIPKMLTFEGANFDIAIGATAPLIAWWATRSRSGVKAAVAWNVIGLIVLANVVVRAVLTAPGLLNVLHAEIPNRLIGTFPYTFIPGFFVPLAAVLHVMALRSTVCPLK